MKAKGKTKTEEAEMKFIRTRHTLGWTEITKLKTGPTLDKHFKCKTNWIQHSEEMQKQQTSKLSKNHKPHVLRNRVQPLKRMLGK
jgi:hypothetical protein